MKNQFIFFILFSFTVVTGYTQKKIIGTPIEGTNLFIEAEAETISKVTFKIKKNVNEKIEELPNTTLNPFNKYSFRMYLEGVYQKLKKENKESIGVTIEDDFQEILNAYNTKEDTINYYKAKSVINEKINYLYNYFEAQLILIFKYDNEPIAGRLHYNTIINKVQYYPNTSYESYFNNRKRNYHALIKDLYEIRYKNGLGNNDDTLDFKKICQKEDELKYDKYSDTTILSGMYYKKISEHFSDDAKEYKSKYIEYPGKFLCIYGDIINNFRNYNRNKRMQLILERLLQSKNNEVYDNIQSKVNPLKKNRSELKIFEYQKSNVSKLESLKKELNASIKRYKKQLEENEQKSINWSENLKSSKRKKEDLTKDFMNFVKKNDSISINEISIDNDLPNKITLKYQILNDYQTDYEEETLNVKTSEFRLKKLKSEKEELINNMQKLQSGDKKKQIGSLEKDLNSFYLNNISSDLKKTKIDTSINNISRYVRDSLKSINKRITIIEENVKKALQKAPLWKFKADNIQLDINDGFVEHIVVLGHLIAPTTDGFQREDLIEMIEKVLYNDSENFWSNGLELKFVNKFPYGFSSSKDFDDFKEYRLIVYNGKHKQFEMRVGDIFPNYVQTLANDRLDFSPADQVVKLPVNSDIIGSKELKKDKSSKLFNLSAYADFNGLKETDPNGVIQFEVNKLIPLYTKRKTWMLGERYINRGFNYGFLNYINPQFRWSRLNDNNDEKNLILSYIPVFNGATTDSLSYVTQLDLLRHENISIGADLNIFSFDLPTSKMRLEINASGRYARTRVLDTKGRAVKGQNSNNESVSNIVQTYNLNTWRFYPEFLLRLRPEERYGANLSFRPIRFNTVTEDFSNISSEEEFTTTLTNDNKQWLHQVEINAHFSPSGRKDDRFFFRYRYTNTSSWEYNGFSEIQVGYSMSLKF